ncbi:SRPBCC domain-containing protein [Nocardioides sp.]|uniref:SRPBCC family protein n=1 Tax=Nocardioides sp. TaxID=35761 RepID=UPI00286EA21E|nr:SRPBCC domain-containing protein [Nocardioides sp.]
MSDDNGGQHLVIERTFEAPPDLIWKMWTDPEHFAAWYGPGSGTGPGGAIDLRVGGNRLLCRGVSTPEGTIQMWFTGTYLEVIENQRLVYTDSMSDEHGNVRSPAQMGMPEGHPTTTEVSVEIEEVTGGTKMVLTHVGIPAESPGAAGWTMALDKLAARLDEAQRS